jgi:hypothetical protein
VNRAGGRSGSLRNIGQIEQWNVGSGGRSRHVRAMSAASLPCRLSPSTIRVGGVLLAREQRRLAAIVTADVVGYAHAVYEQIYYSSLMPRTYLCARLLETLD